MNVIEDKVLLLNDIHKLFSDEDFFSKIYYCFQKHKNLVFYQYILLQKFLFDTLQESEIKSIFFEYRYQIDSFINTNSNTTLSLNSNNQKLSLFTSLKVNKNTHEFSYSFAKHYTFHDKDYIIKNTKDYLDMLNSLDISFSMSDFGYFVKEIKNLMSDSFSLNSSFSWFFLQRKDQTLDQDGNEITMEEIPQLKIDYFSEKFEYINLLAKFHHELLLQAKLSDKNTAKNRLSKKI